MSAHSGPIAVILERLTAQSLPSKILAGWKVRSYPIQEAQGSDELPAVYFAGFSSEPGQGANRGAAWFRVVVNLIVATKKTEGMVQHAIACDKVMDAIVTRSGDDTVDSQLALTTVFGIPDTFERTTASGIGLQTIITVTTQSIPANFGSFRT